MGEDSIWLKFVLASLATWRITHLLVNEDGPADIFYRLRIRLGRVAIGKLIDCFHCLSFWVAAPIAFFVSQKPVIVLFTWLALSGAACLLERIGQKPVIIQPMDQENEGEIDYGMLRSKTNEPPNGDFVSTSSNDAK
ncbi:DUF1360 domain-containing protein [bacterium]|nr:DUF1360 domain-containing protein [bacterium]